METIIIVSVLSTLGAVAVLTSIVVAFIKLKHKVDGNSFEITINDVHRRMDDIERCAEDMLSRSITNAYEMINNNQNQISLEFDEIRRLIDSRCDKLDAKIKATSGNLMLKTDKQILND
jgi:tetrahydromethanopterin S-methyltransferase subunit G